LKKFPKKGEEPSRIEGRHRKGKGRMLDPKRFARKRGGPEKKKKGEGPTDYGK